MKTTTQANYVKPFNPSANPIAYLEYLDTLIKGNEAKLNRMDELIIESKLIIKTAKENLG
jgi:hypothetical protein